MHARSLPTLSLYITLLACAPVSDNEHEGDVRDDITPATVAGNKLEASGPDRTYSEGSDFEVWKRVRIMDPSGFGQPVEAYSILLPKDWKVHGGVTWPMTQCPVDLVRLRVTASAPDGWFTLDFHPMQAFEYSDDPMFHQGVQMGATTGNLGCPIGPPMDAETYTREVYARQDLGNARVTKVHRIPDMDRELARRTQTKNNNARSAGMPLEHHASACRSELDHGNGQIGQAISVVEYAVGSMPDVWGNPSYIYTTQVLIRVSARYPASRREEAERYFTTMMASYRINPEWDRAVQQVGRNIAGMVSDGIAQRSRIAFETNREISDMNMRSWEKRTQSQDRGIHQFSQTVREVETWTDPSGGSVELGSGYTNAWSKGDGTYILSNDALFDPNVALKERWNQMRRE